MEAPSRALAFQHKLKTLVGFISISSPIIDSIDHNRPNTSTGKKKGDSGESDDYDDLRKRRRCRNLETLDGLTVCLQATIVILFHDHAFVIDHKQRRIQPE